MEQNKTPFHYAIEKKHIEMIELLISKGADIHAKTFNGNVRKKMWYDGVGKVPIHLAAENNLKRIGTILIKKGADVNTIDIVYLNKEFFLKITIISLKTIP